MIPEFGFPGVKIATKGSFNISVFWFYENLKPKIWPRYGIVNNPSRRSKSLEAYAKSISFYAKHYIPGVPEKEPIGFDPWE